MNLHLKKIKLFHRTSSRPFRLVDIQIKDGLIHKIGKDLRTPKGYDVFEANGAHASLGWTDIGVQHGEPGFEHREDFDSLQLAAANGGFTRVITFPNTHPVVDNKAQIEYINQHNHTAAVGVQPIGAISKNCDGKELAEMYDMHHAGAIAFSDGKKAIQSAGLMLRALQYVKSFDGMIVNIPNDHSISTNGQVNEGIISTTLGIKGIPHLSEELMVHRDIELATYTDSRIHLANISSAGSVDLIRKAKKKGLNITASVPILNLIYDDASLENFDADYKVWPPLRTKKDIKALKKGLMDGTIDAINSNHVPLEDELKKKEFLYASFGATGLETLFSLGLGLLNDDFALKDLIEMLAYRSKRALNLSIVEVEEGSPANLTLFDPKAKWTYKGKQIHSKSKNNPCINKELVGKVLAIVNNNRLVVNT